jgi:hypothetical protein
MMSYDSREGSSQISLPRTRASKDRKDNTGRSYYKFLLRRFFNFLGKCKIRAARFKSKKPTQSTTDNSANQGIVATTGTDAPAGPEPTPAFQPINFDAPYSTLIGRYVYEFDLRQYTIGKPPKKSYLTGDYCPFPCEAEPVEALDIRLEKTMTPGNDGNMCLPVTPETIRMMGAYYNKAEQINDASLFEYMLINININNVYVHHFKAVMRMLGKYCRDLIIVAPLEISNRGNVFIRDLDDLGNGTDWALILSCFPNLHTLTFEYPEGVSRPWSRETLLCLHGALACGDYVKELKKFKLKAADKVCADFCDDLDWMHFHGGGGPPRYLARRLSPVIMAAARGVSCNGFRQWNYEVYCPLDL